MSEPEEVSLDDLREQLEEERTKRRGLAVRLQRVEERLEDQRGLLRRHVVGGDDDGE